MSKPERGNGEGRYAEVALFASVDRPLTYRIPPEVGGVETGSLVRVPLRNRRETGIVLEVRDVTGSVPAGIRNLYGSADEDFRLGLDLIRLARWIAGYYLAPLGRVLETLVPAPVRRGTGRRTEVMLRVPSRPAEELLAAVPAGARRQQDLLRFLCQQAGPVPRNRILQRLGVSPSVCRGLVERGLVCEEHRTLAREAYEDDLTPAEEMAAGAEPPPLTGEQQAAVDDLKGRFEGGGGTVLLHGVTGSGKTEVYLAAMESVLARGRRVLFLVPEISLAPQTVARLRARLTKGGHRVIVWHSNLSEGQRADAFRTAVAGDAAVVVGARSAVFAPLPDLGLVIVDEEHEGAYKQEESPRYHGRDVAIVRAHQGGIPCLLGSATPSLETLANVRGGKYGEIRIRNRVDGRKLPRIHVVDMRRVKPGAGGRAVLSPDLRELLVDRFEKREQAILFMNRRGYSTSALCPDCGHVAECHQCAVPMTLHRKAGEVRCHLCGHRQAAPSRCPSCGSANFLWRGFGTQQIEEVVARAVPGAKVVRVDADSTRRRNELRVILGEFRRGRIDILVGTQMIAKGLDFPNVTLVGMVDADVALHQEDFRASERTFQLIVQVSGRAGRGDRAGEVVVQTHTPHAEAIQFARKQEFDGFLEAELSQRKEFGYPPFCHLIRLLFSGTNEELVAFASEKWVKDNEARFPGGDQVRGPAPAPIPRIENRHRVQLWLFSRNVARTVSVLRRALEESPLPPEVKIAVDVDAYSLR